MFQYTPLGDGGKFPFRGQGLMIRNYLKIAIRNLLRYRFISFINLFGLTVGLTCCLLITTYILNELSYDKYNKNADNIYRVTRSFNNSDGVVSLTLSTVAPPFGYSLMRWPRRWPVRRDCEPASAAADRRSAPSVQASRIEP